MFSRRISLFVFLIIGASGAIHAHAETFSYRITIKNHRFSPTEIKVPAGKKIKLRVHNQDPTPEEFESDDLRREKIINGKRKATIFIGPLSPGRYHYYGDFNKETANGYVVAE